MTEPDGRGAVAARGLTADAVAHLTAEVAMHLPFEDLALFKALLKKFFSSETWRPTDADALSRLVSASLDSGWWEHPLDDDLMLRHGFIDGRYEIFVTGADSPTNGLFDRVFSGPVIPEATPHPSKIRFTIGGTAAPGVWFRRGDDIDDSRVAELMAEEDITDVMVAGDFVTVGLSRSASWEDRLDEVLDRVTALFYDPAAPAATGSSRTRDELVGEGLRTRSPEELHLLDPDDESHRARLTAALRDPSAETRRLALATLAQSSDEGFAAATLTDAYTDTHRIVRRMAIDGAADLGTESVRALLEQGLGDDDAWVRWKAIRGLRELGVAPSLSAVRHLVDDDDFQVRFEAAAATREAE
jgi:hypothetical protein